MLEDVDPDFPAVFQVRKLKDYKTWSCIPYPKDRWPIPLLYTEKFGEAYPWLKFLKFVEMSTHSDIRQFIFLTSPVFMLLMWQFWPINPLIFTAGIMTWTLFEYVIHRFVFHNSWCNTHFPEFTFLLHYNHHKSPNDFSRLLTPYSLFAPFSVIIYCICTRVIFPNDWNLATSFLLGVVMGFMIYDVIHYMSHYSKPYLRIQQHHLGHHFLCEKKFGFSIATWDKIFQSE